jgi:hypothetical protein
MNASTMHDTAAAAALQETSRWLLARLSHEILPKNTSALPGKNAQKLLKTVLSVHATTRPLPCLTAADCRIGPNLSLGIMYGVAKNERRP